METYIKEMKRTCNHVCMVCVDGFEERILRDDLYGQMIDMEQ